MKKRKKKKKREKYIPLILNTWTEIGYKTKAFNSKLGKLDSDLAAATGNNIALGTIVGVIFTIAQCHNENQEANHCHGEFDPRKHLFFPERDKKINEVISNIQH